MIPKIQIGKNGITDNFLNTLENYFRNHKNVKISVLKSGLASEDNNSEMKKYEDEILKRLGKNFTAKVIGHTIVVKKWRKAVQ